MRLYYVILLFLDYFLNSESVHLHSLIMQLYGWLVLCMSKHVALGLYVHVFTLLCCFVLYCLFLAFRTLMHEAAAIKQQLIWRQFHLNFGILTFGYCLLEIHLICAVSTPKRIQQKPFLPEVVCGICGKVDNTVSLLGTASLCFSGVFQGCHVSRVLFEFHSCLWLP